MGKRTAGTARVARQETKVTPIIEARPKNRSRVLKIVIALMLFVGGGNAAWYAIGRPAAVPEAAAPQKMLPIVVTLKPFTLETLLDLAHNRGDAAARMRGGPNSREQDAEQKLRLLLGYRQAYQVRFATVQATRTIQDETADRGR